MPLKLRLGNWIGLAAIVVLVDQWTKHLVRGALRNGEVQVEGDRALLARVLATFDDHRGP